MMMVLVRFVECSSLTLHPGMRFKFFPLFTNPDAQVRGDSLPLKQPPEGKRFCQTGRMNQSVPICGVDHVRGHSCIFANQSGVMFWICI